MRFLELQIRRFRNLEDVRLAPAPGLNALWGENAQGKTNLLEAARFLAAGRSFRTAREEECLALGAEAGAAAWLRGEIERAGVRHTLEITLTRQGKDARADGKTLRRLTDLWGMAPVTLFTPEDLQMVGGGPAGRRLWLDMALSQISHGYLEALRRFSGALRRRNALLRRAARDGPGAIAALEGQVAAWEAPLAAAAAEIHEERRAFLRDLLPFARARHAAFSRERESLDLRLVSFLSQALRRGRAAPGALDGQEAAAAESAAGAPPAIEDEPRGRGEIAEVYARALARRRREDFARAQTTLGPHRDDLALTLDGREARLFASQGQRRAIALSLRLAEVDLGRARLGEPPALLLDDILSELDRGRLEALLDGLAKEAIQTILTTTDMTPLREFLAGARVWKVENGRIQEL